MIRIVICSGSKELALGAFESARETLRGSRISSELSYSTKTDKVRDNLTENTYYYDILILDALDPGCLSLAREVRSRNLVSALIFIAEEAPDIASLLTYRPSACIVGAGQPLDHALRACCAEQSRFQPYFTIKNKGELLRINYDDILYFESRLRVVVMHSKRQTVEFYAKLDDVLQRLPPAFLRCHQSYIVNMDQVRQLDKSGRRCVMITGESIEISKSRYAEIAGWCEADPRRR